MTTPLLYCVQRLNWVHHGTRFEHQGTLNERFIRLPGATRVASFTDEGEAVADLTRREEAARRVINPFCCHGMNLAYQTSFDEDRLHDWLLDGGIEPPVRSEKGRDWIAWWARVRDSLDEMQWVHVWKALDRVTFHEIVERVSKPVVYVVARIGWVYNDNGYEGCPEGSEPIQAYRSRTLAENERQRLEVETRQRYRYFDGFDLTERLHRQSPFHDRSELHIPDRTDPSFPLFFEVLEVEIEDTAGVIR
jgi:hypothetical protein